MNKGLKPIFILSQDLSTLGRFLTLKRWKGSWIVRLHFVQKRPKNTQFIIKNITSRPHG